MVLLKILGVRLDRFGLLLGRLSLEVSELLRGQISGVDAV
jgi:hypothetical protein